MFACLSLVHPINISARVKRERDLSFDLGLFVCQLSGLCNGILARLVCSCKLGVRYGEVKIW